MAVVEQETLEQMPRSRHLQLGLSSLLGAALLLFCLGFVLGGLSSMWDALLESIRQTRVQEAVAAALAEGNARAADITAITESIDQNIPAVMNEFLSGALLLILMIGVGTGIAIFIRQLDRASAQPGLRAGVVFGALGLYVFLGLTTKLGWAMAPAEADEFNLVNVVITVLIVAAMGFVLLWLFTRPGFSRWLVRIENQGWFHAISYKGNQGVRVRRGTIIALLAVGVCGIITMVSHGSLGSGRYGANNWIWEIPFTTAAGRASLYLPLMHQIHITIPIILALGSLWIAWRVVNWPAFADFLIATEAEINKVSWTTARRLKQDTLVVLVAVFLFTTFLFVIDLLWIQVLTHPWVHVLQVDVRGEVQKQQEKTQW